MTYEKFYKELFGEWFSQVRRDLVKDLANKRYSGLEHNKGLHNKHLQTLQPQESCFLRGERGSRMYASCASIQECVFT